ncbi:MAG: hypothetical protein H7245_14335 [Candidatus Saccharibacteria bacterium]|nr:hypothetical protein [Pseudorhodobacter sp.]
MHPTFRHVVALFHAAFISVAPPRRNCAGGVGHRVERDARCGLPFIRRRHVRNHCQSLAEKDSGKGTTMGLFMPFITSGTPGIAAGAQNGQGTAAPLIQTAYPGASFTQHAPNGFIRKELCRFPLFPVSNGFSLTVRRPASHETFLQRVYF